MSVRLSFVAPLVFLFAIPGAGESLPDVAARAPWTLLSRNDDASSGYLVQKRVLTGAKFSTYRLEAVVDSPPDIVARVAARNLVDPDYHQKNTDKTILRNDSDAIVVYSYIHVNVPFVSDRDVISRVESSYDIRSRTHRVSWKTSEEGPPRKKGVVRVEHSQGSWTFSPTDEGKTRAVYLSETEIAGYMPGWFVDSTMEKSIVQGIQSLREAVERERRAD